MNTATAPEHRTAWRSKVIASRTRWMAAWVLRRWEARAAAVRCSGSVAVFMPRHLLRLHPRHCGWLRGRLCRCRCRRGRWRGRRWTRHGRSSPGVCAVQREGLAEQAESGQRLLQAVDGAGDGLEISVQVIGRGIVWAAFGQLSPLLAFTLPVKEIRAGEDKLVAVVAFQAPEAAPTVDDGLGGCRSRPRRGYCGG